MKKKILLLLTVVFAALAAAFAFAGCFGAGDSGTGTDGTPATKREYAVFDDGCGKKYTLRDGEQITVYYGYDAEKVLDFSVTYYNEATNEKTDANDDLLELPCNKSTVYTYNASPLNEDGTDRGICYLTVIVSAQAMTSQLVENGRPVNANIYENAGAVYMFVPELTGVYTVSCVCDDEEDKAEFTVTDKTGEVVDGSGKGVFNEGWKYYVHVSVKVGKDHTSAGVKTGVTFTPPVVTEGENEVTLTSHSTFAFTPEVSGAYTVWDDGEGSYLSYEITYYDDLTESYCNASGQRGDAILYAGTEYYLHRYVGYPEERQAKLTVKQVDRELAADTENELEWNKMYVFTADRTSNYKFAIVPESLSANVQFTVYGRYGKVEYGKIFNGIGEFDLVLDEGEHVISVSENCTVTALYSPNTLICSFESAIAHNGEVLLFTAPISCVYGFTSLGHDSAQFAVTDKDGNDMNGKRLTAGEEYQVVVTYGGEDSYYDIIFVTATPVPDGEITINRNITDFADGNLYVFTPSITGRYKFAGADGLQVYNYKYEAEEADGDTAYLIKEIKYYVIISANIPAAGGGETQAQEDGGVKVIFYPHAIAVDTGVKTASANYLRLELSEGCTVNISVDNLVTPGKILNADLEVVKVFEIYVLTSTTVTYTFEEGGIYYMYLQSYSADSTVEFVTRPAGCTGEFVAERGVGYKFVSDGVCRFENVSESGEITVTVNVGVRAQSIMDCVKVYYETESGGKRYIVLQKLNGDYNKTAFTFNSINTVKTYFVEVVRDIKFVIE